MSAAEVRHETVQGHCVATLAGEVDLSRVPALRDEFERVLGQLGGDLLVDLSATTFLDSAGINLLYELHRVLAAREQHLRLIVPPANLIHRTLTVTGAGESFPIHASLGEALAAADAAATD